MTVARWAVTRLQAALIPILALSLGVGAAVFPAVSAAHLLISGRLRASDQLIIGLVPDGVRSVLINAGVASIRIYVKALGATSASIVA